MRVPTGLRPLTPAERKRIARDNDRALFPSLVVQRLLVTCDELERSRVERVSRPAAERDTPSPVLLRRF